MTRVLYFVIWSLLFCLEACTPHREREVHPDMPADYGEISFSVAGSLSQMRAAGDPSLDRIDMIIADADHRILERAIATQRGTSYHASVHLSREKRFVHFLAGFDDSLWSDDFLGKDVREVLPRLSTDKSTAWSMVQVESLLGKSPFKEPIVLVRNQPLVLVTVANPGNYKDMSYSIYNLDRGTLCAFDPTSKAFVHGAVTVPPNAELRIPTDNDFVPADGTIPLSTFERVNSVAGKDYSCILLRGKSLSGSYRYFKIDIEDEHGHRPDLIRGRRYHVKIKGIDGDGHGSILEAIHAAADNTNISLDEALDIYPSISDGQHKLEVDRTLLLVTKRHGSKISFMADYHYKTGDVWHRDLTRLKQPRVTGVEGYLPAVKSATLDPSTGRVTCVPESLPEVGEKRSLVTVYADYMERNLPIRIYRKVLVVLTSTYRFSANAKPVERRQGAPLSISFSIPASFPKRLLPQEIGFVTHNFYPDASNPMRFTVKDGTPMYIYTINPGEYLPGKVFVVRFRSNRRGSAERIFLSSPYYFEDLELDIRNR